MPRFAPLWLAASLGLLIPSFAGATVIDNFESGAFSVSRWEFGGVFVSSFPSAGHCIAAERVVRVYHEVGGIPPKPIAAELVPLESVDDGVTFTFPANENLGYVELRWEGGPWDLTENYTLNRLGLRTAGGGADTRFWITMEDGQHQWANTALIDGQNYYPFDLWSIPDFDPTHVTAITFSARSYDASTSFVLKDISTSSGSTYFMTYKALAPRVLTWLCEPHLGGQSLGWDWAIGWPSEPELAGPELQIQGISGAGCAGVELEVQDSGDGGYGPVGLVSVDWQAADFDNGIFEMDFVTDPSAGYVASLVGDPVVTTSPTGFVISHDVHVEDVFGIPDGVVHQELIVTPVPGQEIWLDYVEAIPLGGPSGVGYSLSFGYTGSLFDPGLPLLEMYTTASFGDDVGMTGAPRPEPGTADAARTLRALPSVTRAGTRFVLGGEPRHRSSIDVFDVTGRIIRRLDARDGEAAWNGTDSRGVRVAAGVYFGRAGGVSEAARVVLVR